MVTDALNSPAEIHIDRIINDILTTRDWHTAPTRLLVACDYGDVIEGASR